MSFRRLRSAKEQSQNKVEKTTKSHFNHQTTPF
jgi:hypothetical protein